MAMRQIRTEIEIESAPEKVWEVLADFAGYPEWNPFITCFEGEPEEGHRFRVRVHLPGSKPMTFTPLCLVMQKNREFRWLGHLFVKGLFDGEHIFQIEEKEDGTSRFVHREKFRGLLVPLLWKRLERNTRKGFGTMNRKLKERVEQKSSVMKSHEDG